MAKAKNISFTSSQRAYYRLLGSRIKCLREAQGLAQAELATALGVTQQTWHAYEMGERRIAVSLLSALAERLGVTIDELIDVERPLTIDKRGLSLQARHLAKLIQGLSVAQRRRVYWLIDIAEKAAQLHKGDTRVATAPEQTSPASLRPK